MGTIKQNFKSGHFFINIKVQILDNTLPKALKSTTKETIFISYIHRVSQKGRDTELFGKEMFS